MRRPLVIGNWKMHGSRQEVDAVLTALVAVVNTPHVDVAVCPSFVHLERALRLCKAWQIEVGAQDCSHTRSGAYTGEVAAAMLADIGCRWVILGHSERRQYHAESDNLVAAKLNAAIDAGLQPIVCIGETGEQRENGEAEAAIGGQLEGALQGQGSLEGLVIAYEPVWAIGTGVTAKPEQAQQMHEFIRQSLEHLELDADATRVIYGGSVKATNAAELFSQPDIDGALVGGAALDADAFGKIIEAASVV